MATIHERVEELEKRLAKAKEQQRKIDAKRRAVEAKKKRTLDDRKKMLIGAMYLRDMERNDAKRSEILARLDRFLTRPHDRKVFDLPEREDKGGQSGGAQ